MPHEDNDALEDALMQRILEVSYALDDAVRTLTTMQGVLEVGRRELGHKVALLRELSPGIKAPEALAG